MNRKPDAPKRALSATEYDEQWRHLGDFSRFNPGVRHRRRMILELVSALTPKTVVDIGCGPGQLVRTLLQLRPDLEIMGVDLSPEVIAKNSLAIPGITFEVADLADGPLPQQFDLVVCSEVIEHLDDWRLGVSHLTRMVAPGGYLLVTCPSGPIYDTEVSFGHVEHPEKNALRSEMEQRGLATVSLRQWGFPMYRALKYVTNVNSDWALSAFGSGDYGYWQRLTSNLAYWVTRMSVSDHRWGCQLVGLFRRPSS